MGVYYKFRLDPADFALPVTNTENWPDFRAPRGQMAYTTRGRNHYQLVGKETDPLVCYTSSWFTDVSKGCFCSWPLQ